MLRQNVGIQRSCITDNLDLEIAHTVTGIERTDQSKNRLIWRTSRRRSKFTSYPSCQKQPPARFRSIFFAASPRFRNSDSQSLVLSQLERIFIFAGHPEKLRSAQFRSYAMHFQFAHYCYLLPRTAGSNVYPWATSIRLNSEPPIPEMGGTVLAGC